MAAPVVQMARVRLGQVDLDPLMAVVAALPTAGQSVTMDLQQMAVLVGPHSIALLEAQLEPVVQVTPMQALGVADHMVPEAAEVGGTWAPPIKVWCPEAVDLVVMVLIGPQPAQEEEEAEAA